jgi:hypothetical protein
MPPTHNACGALPTSSGLGLHFISPKKSQDPKKTQAFIHIPGVDAKHKRLLDQMATLMNPPPVLHIQNLSSVSTPPQSEAMMSIDDSNYDDLTDYIYDANSDDYVVIADQPDPGTSDPTDLEHENPGRRILPNKMSNNLHSAWKALAPTLVEVFLKYSARTHGHPLPEACPVISACAKCSCAPQRISIICLLFDHKLFICSSSSS